MWPAAKQQPKKQDTDQDQGQDRQVDSRAMGHTPSKLDQFKDALHRTRSSADDASVATRPKNKLRKTPTLAEAAAPAPRPGAQRPPTLEYHKGDAKAAPTVDAVATPVSPVSPASSSGSPRPVPLDGASEQPQPQPPRDACGPERPGPQPAPLAIPRKRLPPSAPNLLGVAGSGPDEPGSDGQLQPQSPPDDVARGRTPEPAGWTTPPPRIPSVRSEARAPAVQRPCRPAEGDARIIFSDTHGPLYRGRDGTLYPEMKVTREPDPRAACFPVQTERPPEPGSVIAARPLRDSHFDCYQHHRTMNRLSNRHYPLTCQTCDKADAEDRWVCTFCHLRICEACLRALNAHQRVLRRLVDELASSTPFSLSSISRPGSALGLQLAS